MKARLPDTDIFSKMERTQTCSSLRVRLTWKKSRMRTISATAKSSRKDRREVTDVSTGVHSWTESRTLRTPCLRRPVNLFLPLIVVVVGRDTLHDPRTPRLETPPPNSNVSSRPFCDADGRCVMGCYLEWTPPRRFLFSPPDARFARIPCVFEAC